MTKIVVIGAGVAGLTTSYLLAQKGYDVSIIAKNLPGDIDPEYTSPYAGAEWYSLASKDEIFEQELDKPGYFELRKLAKDPKSGIHIIDSYEYIKFEDADNYEFPWFVDFVEGFEMINDRSKLPDDCKFGFKFSGLTATTTIYLYYLLNKCVELGVTYKRYKLDHINDAFSLHHSGEKSDYVINCTGLLAGKLNGVNDPLVYPVRGQTLLVTNTPKKQLTVSNFEGYDDEMLYIIPRKEGGTILGGCFQKHSTVQEVDTALIQRISERAVKYCPELIDPSINHNKNYLDIVKVNVGFRPYRKGGPRIEIDKQNSKIIHNYGAGGSGYQSSYGMSGKTIELLEKSIKLNGSKSKL
ncbi:FAD-dependent oxidoreductase [Ascoidea rubescens DSM 1968]|uniref:D-amino acid oxidase n=1 Tax=Ascoidea rubescens DSM 1968 TaxID=1344418 RepID=A0A1D2VF67_9ASCO|nr:D-amino acid oxidase [Ascoidea rubescens DSM 1968]ODV60265.1 D-amino acid oxidase [Ascoidea rubescens DSM 1968]